MRTVALEEHFNIPSLVARIPKEAIRRRGYPPPEKQPQVTTAAHDKLKDLGWSRLAEMDAGGVCFVRMTAVPAQQA